MTKQFDPAELLQCLMDIARTGARQHISQEFQRCAVSYAGSRAVEDSEHSPRPAAPPPATGTGATTPHAGPATTDAPIARSECEWWEAQDQEGQWWTGDDTDPKSWK